MYVNELAKISASYLEFMHRKDGSGYTALQILKNGSSREHYEGLQNSSRLLSRLGPERARLATGTTRNEQLHRELKSWMRNIISSHRQRLESGLRVFLLSKLLTHSSACYHTITESNTVNNIRNFVSDSVFFLNLNYLLLLLLPSFKIRMT